MQSVIVLLNWNGWKDTIECLESIYSMSTSDFKVVLVDNYSNDDSLDRISDWLHSENKLRWELIKENDALPGKTNRNWQTHDLIVISNSSNYGFAGGNNVGINFALYFWEFEYLWLLNTDTTVDADALRLLIAEAVKDHSNGIVGSVLAYYHEPEIIQAIGGGKFFPYLGFAKLFMKGHHHSLLSKLSPSDIKNGINYIMGASMLVRRTTVEDLNGLDDSYFLFAEELDFAYRAQSSGWKIAVATGSIIYHKESSSTANRKYLYFYLMAWSNIHFLKKHYSNLHLITASLFLIINSIRSKCINNVMFTMKGVFHSLCGHSVSINNLLKK